MEGITAMKIGFIGQGFIGKSYADDFERRGYTVVRYSSSSPLHKDEVRTCGIVFVAVPTPTTPKGFSYAIVEEVLRLAGKGATVVVKSTILPGTTKKLQKKFPHLYIMHSPEFLVLKTAARDAAHPERNIIGIAKNTPAFRSRARAVLRTLPKAPFEAIVSAEEAELIKYAGNSFLYLRVLFANLIYDIAKVVGANYDVVRKAISADPRIGGSHLQILHDSGHRGAKTGRGAGGVCFIKDVAALTALYKKAVKDPHGHRLLRAAIEKNINLLVTSGKDLDLLRGVHGEKAILRHKKKK